MYYILKEAGRIVHSDDEIVSFFFLHNKGGTIGGGFASAIHRSFFIKIKAKRVLPAHGFFVILILRLKWMIN